MDKSSAFRVYQPDVPNSNQSVQYYRLVDKATKKKRILKQVYEAEAK